MAILKRTLALFLISALAVSAWAERVSQDDAATVANNFMNAGISQSGAKKTPAKRMVLKKAAQAEESQFYVYENADGEGWVMVAANDIARPILAYSDEGHFRTDNQPSNVKGWLRGYNRQIRQAEQDSVQATEEVKQEWRQLRKGTGIRKGTPVIAALIKTKWDQDEPYWNQCPTIGGARCLTGCVATAMAQVMNYWQWPVTGTGSASVTVNGQNYSVDFSTGNYDWNNMLDKYRLYYNDGNNYYTTTTSGTTTQQNAVAKLMYHCGVAAEMDYGTDVSGAYTIYPNKYSTSTRCAQYALINNFGYNSSTIKSYYRPGGSGYSSVNDATWHNYLKTELDAKRPIMYAGSDSEGGHSFICDGYDNTTPTRKYHFNWGWSGYCDGYYDVDALVPGTGGSGSGNGSYNDDQDIIIGIEPPEVGHIIKLNGTGCTLSSDKQRVENGNSVTVTITPTDATYDYTSVTVKLGSTTISSSNYTLSANKQTLTINGSAITGDSSNDLTITVVWTKNRYKYELLGENCTEELSGTLDKDAPLNLTITPEPGYTLANAACWEVYMGDNELTYGTGFTYSGTTFSITSVTGDVEIYAYGGRQVTWNANGSLHVTNMSISDKITLPSNPADCAGAGGKKFVGWCTISDYSHATTAPTFAKDGDTYSVATYYAVYATPAASSAPRRAAAPAKATSIAVGDEVILVCETNTVELSGFTTTGTIYGQGTSYTETPTGTYSFSVVAGSADNSFAFVRDGKYWNWASGNSLSTTTSIGASSSWTVSFSGGNATISNVGTSARTIRWNNSSPRFACYTSGQTDVQLYKISGGSSSYIDYSTTCTTCSNTPIMSFSPATVDKTTADGSFTNAVSISGKGSGQTVTYSSSDETVATVSNSGVVTLKGKVGSTTITASVAADGDYCAASASYTINVTAAPIDVTLYYNGTSASLTDQANPYTLPTGAPYNTAMCDGNWTFDGWYGSTYAKSTDKPTYITELEATGSAHAVYKTTETSGGGGSSTVASVTFAEASSDGSADKSSSIKNDLVDFDSGISSYSGSKVYAATVGIKLGSSSATGSITLNLSSAATVKTVKVTAKKYGSDTGTLSVKAGSTDIGSAQAPPSETDELTFTAATAVEGVTTITVATSSKRAYIASITVIAEGGGSSTTYYATSPDCSATIDHTVTWKACGEIFHTQGFADGAALVLPASNPADNAGKTFVGWTATGHHTGASAPADLFNTPGSKTVTADVTYYAVFH